jgi:8-hydroxy-5-deazaflavin:NADPH oxidoreductase
MRLSGCPDRGAVREETIIANESFAERERREFLRIAASGVAAFAIAGSPRNAVGQTAAGSPPKIGMIGAGREGSALGTLFVKAGHPLMFSSRHPERLKDLAAGLGPLAQAGTVEQAIAFGDVVVLVVPYTAIEEIGKAHARALASKILVMDVSNPIARRDGEAIVKWVAEQGGPGLATAKLVPGARIVRAFNAIGAGRLAQLSHRPGEPVGVPIAGDDAKAIATAQSLIRAIGFEPVLVGGLAMGKHLVPGTPLGGERTPAEIQQIAGSLR